MKGKLFCLIVLVIVVFVTLNVVASQDIQATSSTENIVCAQNTAIWPHWTGPAMFQKIIIPAATFFVLLATFFVLCFYTEATRRIARSTDETTVFDAVTRIHERMANSESYKRRGYLHAEFDECFKKANQNFNALPIPNQTVEKFYEILDSNAREAVEMTLNDFDIITLPYFLEIEAAKKLARAYKTVLDKTSEHILPFVKLQQKLRKDEAYKWPYLYLLKELGGILSDAQITEFNLIDRKPEEILRGQGRRRRSQ